MDDRSSNTGRIPRLPYELQLGIFCSMTDMDSVRSLILAYPYCEGVFKQNEKRITDAVYINKACKAIEELTESRPVSFRLVKWCILLVCYEDRTLHRDSPWIVDYFSNKKLPPDMDQSTIENRFEGLQVLVPSICKALEAHARYDTTRCTFENQDASNTTPQIKPLDGLVDMFLKRSRRHRTRRYYVFPSLDAMQGAIGIYTEVIVKKDEITRGYWDLKRSVADEELAMGIFDSAKDSLISALDNLKSALENAKSTRDNIRSSVESVKRAQENFKCAVDYAQSEWNKSEEILTQLKTTLQDFSNLTDPYSS
ncbi:hypothetical protein F5Y07DRAFT_398610 [Xylaria sp. FL0933]|nr:hypothetical protein F5Y07DRAFT_398610 [Xylaria sp. FL0933]